MSGLSSHGHDWTKVARYVGHAVSRSQCLKRWVDMVDPDESLLAGKGDWSPAEDEALLSYVKSHRVRGPFGGIEWSRVVFTVGRPFHECKDRFRDLTEEDRVSKRRKFTKKEVCVCVRDVCVRTVCTSCVCSYATCVLCACVSTLSVNRAT